jgi:hypothetical protein
MLKEAPADSLETPELAEVEDQAAAVIQTVVKATRAQMVLSHPTVSRVPME